jgi:uncharacterized protein YcbX
MIRVSALHLYPIKGTRAIDAGEAEVGDRGFVGDRRFLITEPSGRFLTQRELPRMALIAGRFVGDVLRLEAPGMAPLELPRAPAGGEARSVEVWRDRCDARSVGEATADWVSRFLGKACELVYMPDDSLRQIDRKYAADGERVSFADGFPFLMAAVESLAELARRGAAVPMSRFRPNLVVEGAPPFEEDGWRAVRIGAVRFRVVKPCARCVVTTVDQDTGVAGVEPLRTLAGFRKVGSEVMFGQNLVHEGRGVVRVGDEVVVER